MRNTRADRRSQRTRQMLGAALVELMLRKRYDDITVQDIIDEANVGRSTFYAHYLDKDDLLVSGFTRVLDALTQHIDRQERANESGMPGLTPFFEHVQAHRHLYKALVRGGGIDLLYKNGHERLRRNIEQHLRALVPAEQAPALPLPLVADYLAATIVHLVKWWLESETPYTPAQMDALFHQLVMPGVQATLHLSGTATTTPRQGTGVLPWSPHHG
ncbi:MAG TPA: TetR/AcrR family transcriptional regulator [Ardenticatenaceae bacterium]|nr:TetR/AcrR family transcriptional regulator [Ardenticatenaceae bacterium]